MIYINLNDNNFIKNYCMDFEHIPFLNVNKFFDDGGTLQEFVSKSYHCFILYGNVFNFEDDLTEWKHERKHALNLTEFSKENSFDDWFSGYFNTSYIIDDQLYVFHPFAAMSGEICITENNDLFNLLKKQPELLRGKSV